MYATLCVLELVSKYSHTRCPGSGYAKAMPAYRLSLLEQPSRRLLGSARTRARPRPATLVLPAREVANASNSHLVCAMQHGMLHACLCVLYMRTVSRSRYLDAAGPSRTQPDNVPPFLTVPWTSGYPPAMPAYGVRWHPKWGLEPV